MADLDRINPTSAIAPILRPGDRRDERPPPRPRRDPKDDPEDVVELTPSEDEDAPPERTPNKRLAVETDGKIIDIET